MLVPWRVPGKIEKSSAKAHTPPKSAELAYAVSGQTTTEAGQRETGNLCQGKED